LSAARRADARPPPLQVVNPLRPLRPLDVQLYCKCASDVRPPQRGEKYSGRAAYNGSPS
jgi:hypothetical protein